MASSSIETSTNPTSDLASLISEGSRVDEEVLQQYAEKGLLDVPDKDGRTPLMFACEKGLEDTVKFLLANGANPNSKCLKEGNTPMHYACTVEGHDVKRIFSCNFSDPSTCSMISKIAIIKCLLTFGAQANRENLDGWTPPCRAALFRLKDVVDHFLDGDDFKLSLEMKIRVTEILGVSEAIINTICVMEGFDEIDEDKLFYPFSLAIGFQKDATLLKTHLKSSELVDCFKKISLRECHTSEEIESVKQSELGLQAHAFLVGDRVLSSDLKQKYLYPALARFGYDLMLKPRMFEEGCQVLSCAIGLEHRGELKLGSVVENIARGFEPLELLKEEELNLQYFESARDLLCEYESVLNHVNIDNLSDHADNMLPFFASILFNEALYSSTVDILLSTLEAIEKLVRIIRGRIQKENPDKYHKLSSVTFKVMQYLNDEFSCDYDFYFHPSSPPRVEFVIRKTLFYESASYRDRNDWSTLLHLVADGASSRRLLKYYEDLAWVFVRHGCPIDAVNKAGETARDVLIRNGRYDPERNPRLLSLVSRPTTVPTLEELAIRQILQKDLSYLGEVPSCLYGMIKGGLMDSDLERYNEMDDDEMDNDEETE